MAQMSFFVRFYASNPIVTGIIYTASKHPINKYYGYPNCDAITGHCYDEYFGKDFIITEILLNDAR